MLTLKRLLELAALLIDPCRILQKYGQRDDRYAEGYEDGIHSFIDLLCYEYPHLIQEMAEWKAGNEPFPHITDPVEWVRAFRGTIP